MLDASYGRADAKMQESEDRALNDGDFSTKNRILPVIFRG
jgi:hypothetical protein